MKNLLEHIEQLNKWDYYKRNIKKISNWNNKQEHISFIEKFLEISGKQDIQIAFENNNIKFKNFKRSDHVNSVFFLGCLLYENTIFRDKINFYRKGDSAKERDEFYFIWFLTSLMHDFGYYIEKNTVTKFNSLTNDIESLKNYISEKQNSLIDESYYDLLSRKNKYTTSPNLRILLDNVDKYYKCRMDGKIGRSDEQKVDHGIAAGLILFNTLKNIRIKKQKELINAGNTDDIDRSTDRYWGKDLDEFYFMASGSITVHNMRRTSQNDRVYDERKKLYQDYGMNDLILNENKIKKLSIHDDPFLFLFSIADTIEPIKTFKCKSAQYVLENIFIDFIDNHTIEIKKTDNSELDFDKLVKKVEGLEDWLYIEKPTCTDNSIKIIIKEYRNDK